MNKKMSSIIMIIFLLFFLLFMITSSKDVVESVTFSISIWKDNLFPTLFPFFVVSKLLMEYGFVQIISNFLSKPMNKLFKLDGSCGFVLASSLFSGFPSGAKYTTDLVINKLISKEDASYLLTFTHFSNPLFILGMIGTILLNNQKIAIIILVSHLSGGILTGLLLAKKRNDSYTTTTYKNINITDKSLGENLANCIMDSLNTMFLLLGIVTIFLIISSMINKLFSLPPIINVLISGLLEMTQGVKLASLLNVSLLIKTLLITFIISFGGLSVHMQVLGIISKEKIKYTPFFVARIIHGILSTGLVFILYQLFI